MLFAGNGFATHDIESNVLGTSLGVLLAEGTLTEGGHSNHLRVINEVRRHGSIAAAVEAGYVTGGAMATCVRKGVPFVLGGSIRDDGPLPDVYTDTAAAADAMRELIPGVTVALMLASTLHAIAVGNCLPGRRRDVLRRHQPGGRHQAGRPRQPPGPRHRHRRRPLPRPARRRAAAACRAERG